MASITVEYWCDDESGTWGFRVPALGITGGGDATRELAETHCLDAVAYALEAGVAEDEIDPSVERSTLDITVTPHAA